jgi:hypothetical protein
VRGLDAAYPSLFSVLWLVLRYLCLCVIAHQFALFVFKLVTLPWRPIPGPFLAQFTRLWYFFKAYNGHFARDNIVFHQKYGAVALHYLGRRLIMLRQNLPNSA